MINRYLAILFFSMISLFDAWAANSSIGFQMIVKDSNNELVTATGLPVNLKIISPNNCILWEESHSGIGISEGFLNLAIGTGVKGGVTPSGMTFTNVFSNNLALTGLTCLNSDGTVNSSVTSYTALSGDVRTLKVDFNIGADRILSDFNMRASAFAMNSEALNGKSDSDFIQRSVNVTQSVLESLVSKLSGSNLHAESADVATTATTATSAGNVTGIVAVANGGTGSSSVSGARSALGLGSLSVLSPSGTASASTYLRGDGSWASIPAGASGISSLNGLSDLTQSFSIDSSGNSPAFASSAGVHTLSLPLANTVGVTAGLISKSEYDAFNAKQAAGNYLTNLTGDVVSSGFSAGSVTATISAGAVDSAKLANAAVTNSKIVSMDIDKLTSLATKYFTYKPNNVACADQEVLKWSSGNSRWECGSDNSGAGAPADATTSVKGIVQLGTSSDTVAGLVVQANDSRLSDSRAPLGSAGGDLSGTYPNPSVAKISGTALSISSLSLGNVLRYDGTSWVNSTLSSANLSDSSSLIKSSQLPAACAQGQSLTFSSPTGTWTCLNIYGVQVQKSFLAGPSSGSDATPIFRTLASTDLPDISSGMTGVLPIANGGTGASSASAARTALGLSGNYVTDLSGDVTSSGFSAGSVTATIAAAAVSTAKIADSAVSTAKIADASVTNVKIVSMDPDKLSSVAGKYLTYKPNNVACSDQQVLKWSSTNSRWECGSDSSGSSVVDATTSVKGIVQLASSSDTTAGLVVQASDSRLTNSRSPSGSAGGDLSGTYPNPSVAKISGTSVSITSLTLGNVLKFDGTNWVNSALATIASSGSASDLSTGTVATARLGSGTANSSTYLRGDGTWTDPVPSQTGNSGKYLTTNGTTTSWATVSGGGGSGLTACPSGYSVVAANSTYGTNAFCIKTTALAATNLVANMNTALADSAKICTYAQMQSALAAAVWGAGVNPVQYTQHWVGDLHSTIIWNSTLSKNSVEFLGCTAMNSGSATSIGAMTTGIDMSMSYPAYQCKN